MSKSKSKNRRLFCFRYHKAMCVVCGENKIEVIEIHHYDKNRKNNKIENLIPLCPTHHAYVHKGYVREIEYLIDNYVKQFCKNNAFIFKQIKYAEDGSLLKKNNKIQNTFGFLFKLKYVIKLLLTDSLFNTREELKYTISKLKKVREECAVTRIKLRNVNSQLVGANSKLNCSGKINSKSILLSKGECIMKGGLLLTSKYCTVIKSDKGTHFIFENEKGKEEMVSIPLIHGFDTEFVKDGKIGFEFKEGKIMAVEKILKSI